MKANDSMSDDSSATAEAPVAAKASLGAGGLMRAERQRQGLHIAALAASMKVTQAKLEALEAERFDELPDLTFVRALARSVCRTLKMDPAPVLARLPATNPVALERVDQGLNMPFRERPNRTDPVDWLPWRQPRFWLVVGLLVGAGLLVMGPKTWWQSVVRPSVTALNRVPVETAADKSGLLPAELAASAMAGTAVERVDLPATASSSSSVGSGAISGAIHTAAASVSDARVRAIEQTWVQVSDAGGQVLFSRLLAAGESVDLTALAASRIRLGNARGSELTWRGQVVELAPSTRDNVATVDLR